MTDSERITKARQKRKREIVDIMGGKCALCGYDRNITALELHHINKEEKEFSICARGGFPKYDTLIPELKKCILLCANCHREVHNPLEGEDEITLISSFNEEKANHYKELSKLQKQEKFCIDCGKLLSSNRPTRCPECEKIRQRVCERPSREELKDLIRNKPFTQIAEIYGVTDNAIRKWCDAENLPRTKKEINSYSDEEWILI